MSILRKAKKSCVLSVKSTAIALSVLLTGLVTSSVEAQLLHTNLIVNPGAEDSAGAANFGSTAAPSGWTTTSNFTALQYSTGGPGDLNTADSTAIGGGVNFFAGGPSNALSSASQTISLLSYAALIDAGEAKAVLSGYLGGYDSQEDSMTFTATFRDAGNLSLGTLSIGPVTPADRGSTSQLLFRMNEGTMPVSTRSVDLLLTATRPGTGTEYNDGYADNLGFQVVPEPSSALLLLSAVALSVLRRRRSVRCAAST